MNEILAILMIVFDTERVDTQTSYNWEGVSDSDIASNYLIDYLFDPKFIYHDVYAAYDRVLNLGVKLLY